jgi:lipoate synthase
MKIIKQKLVESTAKAVEELEKIAKSIGIKYTFFAPLARSSYRAREVFE